VFKGADIRTFEELRHFTGLAAIDEGAFSGSKVVSLVLPSSIASLARDAFLDCKSLTSIHLPSKVSDIGQNALSGCTAMTSITVDENNKNFCDIDGVLFSKDKTQLVQFPAAKATNYIVPEGTKVLGRDAFYMSKLKSVTLPSTLKELGYDAFGYSTALEGLTAPEGTTTIGNYVFDGCKALKVLRIPSTVTAVGKMVARGCNAITDVYCDIDPPFGIDAESFTSTVYANATLHVPFGMVEAYSVTTGWGEFKTIVTDINGYSLSIQSSQGGHVSFKDTDIAGSQSFMVKEGESFSLFFHPDNGYFLSRLTVNGMDRTKEVADNRYDISGMAENMVVEALFSKKSFSLTIQSSGNGQVVYGTAIANGEQSFPIDYGSSASLAFIPETGHYLASLTVNGEEVTAAVVNNVYTMENVVSDKVVKAVFDKIPVTSFAMTLSVGEGGTVSFSGVQVSDGSREFNVSQGSTLTMTISPHNGYRLKKVAANGNDMTATVTDNVCVIRDIQENVSVVVTFELAPIQHYTMELSVSAGGQAAYLGSAVSNATRSFTVDEGTEVTLSVAAEQQYQLGKLTVDGIDRSSDVNNGSITLGKVAGNMKVNVIFEMIMDDFMVDNIRYGIASPEGFLLKVMMNGDYEEHVDIPASVEYNGITWTVSEIADNAFADNDRIVSVSIPASVVKCGRNVFEGCERLSAIVWQPQQRLTERQAGTMDNPNLLFYTSDRGFAPAGVNNVVVNGHADAIRLTETNGFHCPKAFTADKASFSHRFSMRSGNKKVQGEESMGWETIALPFNVGKVQHATKGEIVPFAAYTADSGTHPFWLYGYDAVRGFVEAPSIEANRPYIICMPNNSLYAEEYNLAGIVEFSAENVTVEASDNIHNVTCGDNMFCPTFQVTSKDVKALNVNNDYVKYDGGARKEGSAFIYRLREARPFEAYMTSVSGAQATVAIFEELPTAMGSIPLKNADMGRLTICSISGQVVRAAEGISLQEAMRGLAPGVYVANGKKIVVK